MTTDTVDSTHQARSTPCAGSASEVERIYKEHAAIAASYEAQRDTTNGSGLPYGPCQCRVCAEWKRLNAALCGGDK